MEGLVGLLASATGHVVLLAHVAFRKGKAAKAMLSSSAADEPKCVEPYPDWIFNMF